MGPSLHRSCGAATIVIGSATEILDDGSESTTVTFAPATAPWGNLTKVSKIEFTRTVGAPVLDIIVEHMRTNGRYEITCIEEGCPGHCSNGYYLNKKGTDATTINQQFKNANLPPCKSTSTCIMKRQGRRRRISHHFFKAKASSKQRSQSSIACFQQSLMLGS